MPAYLQTIVAAHRELAASDDRDFEALAAQALSMAPPRRFADALVAGSSVGRVAVISEIKRRSPSRGDLDLTIDPRSVAAEYQAGGASCLSILTDEQFFGGCLADLVSAREACQLPVLRKDFTVSANDVCDARLMGADAVLLIVAALSQDELAGLLDLASRLSLDALVEVHDAGELSRALDAGAALVGVNQRDLSTFRVDHRRAANLAASIPPGVVSVAESGVRGPDDVADLAAAGYQAVLVGESLVCSPDRRAAVAELVGVGQ